MISGMCGVHRFFKRALDIEDAGAITAVLQEAGLSIEQPAFVKYAGAHHSPSSIRCM
jgi:hypothetical protein